MNFHEFTDRSIDRLSRTVFFLYFVCRAGSREVERRRGGRTASKGKPVAGFHSIIILSEINISTSRRQLRLITGTADPLQITMLARASTFLSHCTHALGRRHLGGVIFRNYFFAFKYLDVIKASR